MKEYIIAENQIFIKNKNNMKRSSIILALSVIIAGVVIFHYNSFITMDLLFSRPTLTFHLPIFFVLVLAIMIVISFNYLFFDGNEKVLYKHTVFGTKKVCEFAEIIEIRRIDVYTNTVHSSIKYEVIRQKSKYDSGIILCNFFPTEHKAIQEFEERIIPSINHLIKK
ncbi:hypothetical protein LZQ00_03080 [Sphingobacterium sp. SRCM116780]|uniref:hypothetical protein n=1 Tax=Sphingobacterium sp. SRCM116780 TaxID=2907623 RepID=UPI001F28C562|nr:hypothetical protein [Sphingobacterium sp. SRCM116780]UIR56808.1 hypothetical protein LZQ00_03080 [Sphingobacterium sp. SRCM116780]